ncbi:MAG TPA: hypothetical protein VFE63_07190 [Roseiarcus sp.]|jgi:hypothetical protein|nr:hypothetical protein [Roseiarcus sp.]
MLDLGSVVLLLALLLAASAVGHFVRSRLPERHRSRDSVELVQVTINLLVTFTAIVLGLLTTSVKAGFDSAYNARGIYAAEFAQLDEYLRQYGPETDKIREQLRAYVAAVIASTWPDEKPPAGVKYPDVSHMPMTGESRALGDIINDVGREINSLEPNDLPRQRLLSECVQQYSDLVHARWRVIEGARGSISPPFYWVLVLWLVILFASLGLTAPANPATILVITLSAISITVAVFVIVDLDLPYGGLFSIPSTSMRNALADMMRS